MFARIIVDCFEIPPPPSPRDTKDFVFGSLQHLPLEGKFLSSEHLEVLLFGYFPLQAKNSWCLCPKACRQGGMMTRSHWLPMTLSQMCLGWLTTSWSIGIGWSTQCLLTPWGSCVVVYAVLSDQVDWSHYVFQDIAHIICMPVGDFFPSLFVLIVHRMTFSRCCLSTEPWCQCHLNEPSCPGD